MSDSAPKAVPTYGGVPIRNVWQMLLYAWDHAGDINRWRGEVESAASLQGLFASVLARLVEQRLRIGLGRDYVGVERVLRGVRGRIDMGRSIRERRFERGQAACRYTSHEADAPRNQIVRSVLARLVQSGDFGPGDDGRALRNRLRRLTRELHEVSIIPVDTALIRRQKLGRNDGDYRLMLSICELIIESTVPTQRDGRRSVLSYSGDQSALQKLFEAFVPAFYRHHLADWRVSTQLRWRWPAQSDYLPLMIPDIVLDHADGLRRLVIDTKFTPHVLRTGRFEAQKVSSAHLYQLYAYLRTQEEGTPRDRHSAGMLLYPSVGAQVREVSEIQGHVVAVVTVDLAAPWVSIEDELLEALGTVSSYDGEISGGGAKCTHATR